MIFVFVKTLLKLDIRFFFFESLMSRVEDPSHFEILKASLVAVM